MKNPIILDLILYEKGEKEVVYECCYLDNIHEGSWTTISIHKSNEGAKKAMNFDEETKRKEHLEWINRIGEKNKEFGWCKSWVIVVTELLY